MAVVQAALDVWARNDLRLGFEWCEKDVCQPSSARGKNK